MEQIFAASEARDHFAELLEQVERGRITVTKHGQSKAVLISMRELAALEETLAVLENSDLMRSLADSFADLRAGRVRAARTVFAELDAELEDRE